MDSNPWFTEKARQIDTPAMLAFGISIITRHAKARQMAELLLFAEAAARAGLNHWVKEAFYDSNSDCCSFTLAKGLQEFGPEDTGLLQAARQTISQFEWRGTVHHGPGAPDEEEPF